MDVSKMTEAEVEEACKTLTLGEVGYWGGARARSIFVYFTEVLSGEESLDVMRRNLLSFRDSKYEYKPESDD